MNANQPNNPREELELKVTALLLGELPETEAAAVREAIAGDAELRKLHDDLQQTIVLVREASGVGTASQVGEPLKLSDERRLKLRTSFAIPPLKKEHRKQSVGSRVVFYLCAVSLVAVLASMLLPSLAKSKSRAQRVVVSSNVRQIEAAKAMWALENNQATAAPTMDDLQPYMGRGSMPSVNGETYVLGKVGEPVTAVMPSGQRISMPTAMAATEAKTPAAPAAMPPVTPAARPSRSPSSERQTWNMDTVDAVDRYHAARTDDFTDKAKTFAGAQIVTDGDKSSSDLSSLVAQPKPGSFEANNSLYVDALNASSGGRMGGAGGGGMGGGGRGSTTLADTQSRFYRESTTTGDAQQNSTAFSLLDGEQAGEKKQVRLGLSPGVSGQGQFGRNLALGDSPVVGKLYKAGEVSAANQPQTVSVSGVAEGASTISDESGRASATPQIVATTQPSDALGYYFQAGVVNGTLAEHLDMDADGAKKESAAKMNRSAGAGERHDLFGVDVAGSVNEQQTAAFAATVAPALTPAQSVTDEKLRRETQDYEYRKSRGVVTGPAPATTRVRNVGDLAADKSGPVNLGAELRYDLGGRDVNGRRSQQPPQKPAADSRHNSQKDALALKENETIAAPGSPISALNFANSSTMVVTNTAFRYIQNDSKADVKGITALESAMAKRLAEEDRPLRRVAANAPVPQPEILTSENNFSTFSLNVSDVSFKLALASLENGQMPDAASIRSEEFINAFDYRDPEATRGAPVAFAFERARYPFAHNRDLLRFSIKTAAAGRQSGRPLNLVLLLDNSGSMERADRVRIRREALHVLATQLTPKDKLSVISFARTARLVVRGISGDRAGEVIDQVAALTPEGGTNLEEAMALAYQTASQNYLPNGINRVVLLTDGAANLGDVEPVTLKRAVESNRKQGIALDCFGIGWDGFNDDLLEVLSRNGDGRYGFINTPEEAATDFVGQLAGALKVAASDVKVQVEFNPKRVKNHRQIGYAKHQLTKEQFRDNTVDAAEIAAQEAGNALYTVEVDPEGVGPIGTVRVRYKVPGTADYRELAWDVPFTGNAPALDKASPAMRLAATASAFSEWLAGSPFAGEVTLDALLNQLRGVPEMYGADARPKKLEQMIQQARGVAGR